MGEGCDFLGYYFGDLHTLGPVFPTGLALSGAKELHLLDT